MTVWNIWMASLCPIQKFGTLPSPFQANIGSRWAGLKKKKKVIKGEWRTWKKSRGKEMENQWGWWEMRFHGSVLGSVADDKKSTFWKLRGVTRRLYKRCHVEWRSLMRFFSPAFPLMWCEIYINEIMHVTALRRVWHMVSATEKCASITTIINTTWELSNTQQIQNLLSGTNGGKPSTRGILGSEKSYAPRRLAVKINDFRTKVTTYVYEQWCVDWTSVLGPWSGK